MLKRDTAVHHLLLLIMAITVSASILSVTIAGAAMPTHHRTVTIDGLDIFYREAGPKEAPTVLLLHGFPISSQMFRNLIPALSDTFHVVAPDYPSRSRIKIWGRARVVEDDAELLGALVDPQYKGHPERAIVFTIEAWDANCPQHILPRYTEAEIANTLQSLRDRITALEAENRTLRDAAVTST